MAESLDQLNWKTRQQLDLPRKQGSVAVLGIPVILVNHTREMC